MAILAICTVFTIDTINSILAICTVFAISAINTVNAVFSVLTVLSIDAILTIGTVLAVLAVINVHNTLLFKKNSVTDNLAGRGNLCYRLDVVITFQCSDNLLNGSNVCVDVVA